MKKIWKIFKRVLLAIAALIVILIISVVIFTKVAPQFGQTPTGADLERIKKSSNYADGKFVNLIETKLGSFGEMMGTIPEYISAKNLKPKVPLPVKFGEDDALAADSLAAITWYGHSSFLIEMDGKRILIDPMLSEMPSPVSFGTSRYAYQQPIPIEELTDIDFVIISHDHYDHLDYKTILKLKAEVGHFYTALGVGSHLKSWGVSADRISEFDWWDSQNADGIQLTACPSRHFSGRGVTDRNSTQWASWVIKGASQNLYFSGDGGYGQHFKEIGDKYGPFDLAMMECGQYNTAWSDIHMMPEESVQAGIDVQGKLLMPIHWGAFALAIHPWTDPIVRFKNEAERLEATIIHPYIGQRFQLGKEQPQVEWWNEVVQ